jgi:hypothetical protein
MPWSAFPRERLSRSSGKNRVLRSGLMKAISFKQPHTAFWWRRITGGLRRLCASNTRTPVSMNRTLRNGNSGFCTRVNRFGRPGGLELRTARTQCLGNAVAADNGSIAIRLFNFKSTHTSPVLAFPSFTWLHKYRPIFATLPSKLVYLSDKPLSVEVIVYKKGLESERGSGPFYVTQMNIKKCPHLYGWSRHPSLVRMRVF